MMRRSGAASMMRRVIGEERIEVPIMASAPPAIATISASLLPCGLCQPAEPCTISHPAPCSFLSLSVSCPGFSGANTSTLAAPAPISLAGLPLWGLDAFAMLVLPGAQVPLPLSGRGERRLSVRVEDALAARNCKRWPTGAAGGLHGPSNDRAGPSLGRAHSARPRRGPGCSGIDGVGAGG